MKNLTIALALVLSAPMFASSALAKAPTQNHHCMKDGTAMPDKTHKECTKEGGKWAKDAAAPAAAAEPEKKAEPAAAKKAEPAAAPKAAAAPATK